MRDAANRDAACARIKRLGFDVEVVSGDREAALAFSGTLSGFALDHGEKLRTVMVVDVGGGSTEVIVGDLREAFAQESVGPSNARHDSSWPHERQASTVRQAKSFDIGSRRVTDMFLPSMPPGRDELAAANSWVAGQMSPYYAQLAQNGFMPAAVYAVAGTATTAASVFKELQVYDPTLVHGTILRIEDLEAILERLSALSLVQCCEVAGLDPLRAPVVVGGLVVLTNALRLSNVSQLVVSETDILEGVLLEALEQTSRRRSDT
jgi:exopolyphosphatase/guanosine-5'-triphosphate,3'-diphosphate pyrophosphatase